MKKKYTLFAFLLLSLSIFAQDDDISDYFFYINVGGGLSRDVKGEKRSTVYEIPGSIVTNVGFGGKAMYEDYLYLGLGMGVVVESFNVSEMLSVLTYQEMKKRTTRFGVYFPNVYVGLQIFPDWGGIVAGVSPLLWFAGTGGDDHMRFDFGVNFSLDLKLGPLTIGTAYNPFPRRFMYSTSNLRGVSNTPEAFLMTPAFELRAGLFLTGF